MVDLAAIQQKIIAFRNERDWSQFHDPKNLAEALSTEAGELQNKITEQSQHLSSEELQNLNSVVIEREVLNDR